MFGAKHASNVYFHWWFSTSSPRLVLRATLHINFGTRGMHCTVTSLSPQQVVLESLMKASTKYPGTKNSMGATALHFLAAHGDAEMIKKLLACKADANIQDSFGITPIHTACFRGNREVAVSLLDGSANPNIQDHFSTTAIDIARRSGCEDIVDDMVTHPARLNLPFIFGTHHHHETFREYISRKAIGETGMSSCIGDSNIFVLLLIAGVDAKSWLLQACCDGDIFVVKCLLGVGIDPNIQNQAGYTLLHYACRNGHAKIVKKLTQVKAYVNTTSDRRVSALYVACAMYRVDIVSNLLQYVNGVSLLHQACRENDFVVATCLVEARVDANTEMDGSSALYLAYKNDHSSTVRCLISAGVDTYTMLLPACRENDVVVFDCVLQSGANLNVQDTDGHSALHLSSIKGFSKLVKRLIDADAQVNILSKEKQSPLHCACRHGSTEYGTCALRVDVKNNYHDIDGKTPLYLASENKISETVKFLLDAEADVNIRSTFKWTPLHIICREGSEKVVQQLLDARACVNLGASVISSFEKCCDADWTPLHLASSNGHTGIVRKLLKNGADVNTRTSNGLTALSIAAKKERSEVAKILMSDKNNVTSIFVLEDACRKKDVCTVSFLLEADVNPNTRIYRNPWNTGSSTVLHLASQLGHTEIVNLLLKFKADPSLQDDRSLLAFHDACYFQHVDVVMLLRDSGILWNPDQITRFYFLYLVANEDMMDFAKKQYLSIFLRKLVIPYVIKKIGGSSFFQSR